MLPSSRRTTAGLWSHICRRCVAARRRSWRKRRPTSNRSCARRPVNEAAASTSGYESAAVHGRPQRDDRRCRRRSGRSRAHTERRDLLSAARVARLSDRLGLLAGARHRGDHDGDGASRGRRALEREHPPLQRDVRSHRPAVRRALHPPAPRCTPRLVLGLAARAPPQGDARAAPAQAALSEPGLLHLARSALFRRVDGLRLAAARLVVAAGRNRGSGVHRSRPLVVAPWAAHLRDHLHLRRLRLADVAAATWYSTIFGLYIYIGSFVGSVAPLCL